MTSAQEFLDRLMCTATSDQPGSRCQECGFYMQADEFSVSQRRKGAKDRRCIDCSNETYLYAELGRKFSHLQLAEEDIYGGGNYPSHLETVQKIKEQMYLPVDQSARSSTSVKNPDSYEGLSDWEREWMAPSDILGINPPRTPSTVHKTPHKRPTSHSDSDADWAEPGEGNYYSKGALATSPHSTKRTKKMISDDPWNLSFLDNSPPSRRSSSVVSTVRSHHRDLFDEMKAKDQELCSIQDRNTQLLENIALTEEMLETHKTRKGEIEHSINLLKAEHRNVGLQEKDCLTDLADYRARNNSLEERLGQLKREKHQLQEEIEGRSLSADTPSRPQDPRSQTTAPLVLIDGQNVMFQDGEKMNDVESVIAAGLYYKTRGFKMRIFLKQMKSLFFVVDCECNTNCKCDNLLSATIGSLNFREEKGKSQKSLYTNRSVNLILRGKQWIFVDKPLDEIRNLSTGKLLQHSTCLGFLLIQGQQTLSVYQKTDTHYPPREAIWRIKKPNSELGYIDLQLKTQCEGRDLELMHSAFEDKTAVVKCPAEKGSSDDKMLLNYVRQLTSERQKNCYIVTNDQYRDHKQLMKGLTINLIRYTITPCPYEGEKKKIFIPEDQIAKLSS